MTYATNEIVERVVRITRLDGKTGSGTVIERAGSHYLMTAAHVLPTDVSEPLRIESLHREEERVFLRVPGMNPKADVAALRLTDDWAMPDRRITLTTAGVRYSQDVLFLGYPYGNAFRKDPTDRLPFVKKAVVSAMDAGTSNIFYLDAINNEGFSGGPVFVPNDQNGNVAQVFAIVHGYHPEWLELHFGRVPSNNYASVPANSGIMLAYSVRHVLKAIDAQAVP